ncbi:MAG TPA: Rieske (2Fe-2S) protein [Cyclobacteriaceae bacterium]|nr:Rieske (2Fe-2S) protein [Cyclobacteriaceae bacterium]
MNRKEFMIGCGLCLLGMPEWLSGCAGTRYLSVPIEGDSLVVPVQSFVSESETEKKYLKYLVVHNDQLEYPICIYRFSENEYKALLMKCTHQGTELQVFGDRIQCPAHGSEFNNKGEVQNGPADTPLRSFQVSTTGEAIKVRLS